MMTSRERVLCALNHEEPDRVPLFIGTSLATTVLAPGYPRLRAHMGLPGVPTRFMSRHFQATLMDEDVLDRLGSDGRAVFPGPAESRLRRDVSEDCVVDDWGVMWRREPGCLYFEAPEPPLRHATIDDLDRYPWPDLAVPSRFVGLAEKAKAIQEAGFACVLVPGMNPFELSFVMRGFDTVLMDLALAPDFFTALMSKLESLLIPYLRAFLRQVGPYIDVIITGDDVGTQDSTMMSPRDYRRWIKPHHARLFAAIKDHTQAKLFYHSDGNIYPLIGDLVEIGVELLNPVQISAGDMGNTARLKREFGKQLSFCGAIDTHWVLPHGSPDEVRREVRRRIKDLGPGGGYIAAAVHCLQPDVPPQNIVAMSEEVRQAGRYPLNL